MQIFNRWLPKAESHLELIKSIKIMYLHDNGVILAPIFALMAKIALDHDALADRLNELFHMLPDGKYEWH